jgi:glycosylphosphatidylinositol transamidase (GPIT) subunit GPI8
MLLFFAGVIFSKDPLAIVFSTSIGWHNYRQSSNAYSFYSRLREFGMTDHQILLINP